MTINKHKGYTVIWKHCYWKVSWIRHLVANLGPLLNPLDPPLNFLIDVCKNSLLEIVSTSITLSVTTSCNNFTGPVHVIHIYVVTRSKPFLFI